jgi:L-ascorbate metabolism protein UlaG (beta-lactamase superfamily)
MSIEPSFRQITLTHIGGPTVFIEIGHLRLLTDPTFESTGYQYHFGAELSSKTSSAMLSPSVLGPVDPTGCATRFHSMN